MNSRHIPLALAFFCGFRAPAQPLDTASAAPVPTPPKEAEAEDAEEDSLRLIPINLGLAPGTSTNGSNPWSVRNYFSLDLVAGQAGEITGVQASLAMNEVKGDVVGVQAAGGLNIVKGSVKGVQASAVNLVEGNVVGYQGAYFLNRVQGNVRGYQGSSVGNLVTGRVSGLQSSSIYGRARSIYGGQTSFVSVTDTLRGVQWGGVNWARNAKGLQWGIVNINRSGEVAQIGLVNIQPDTRFHAESWMDESGLGHLAMNYGPAHWYSLVELLGKGDHDPKVAGIGLGFGARTGDADGWLSLDQSAFVLADVDKVEQQDRENRCTEDLDGNCTGNFLIRWRATAGHKILGPLALFGGVSYNALIAPEEGDGVRLLEPEGSYHWDPTPEVRLWPGVFFGIRL